MAYAIGYQTGTFGNYELFQGFEVGDIYNRTEVASVPLGGSAEEIFAGAEMFRVLRTAPFFQDAATAKMPGKEY